MRFKIFDRGVKILGCALENFRGPWGAGERKDGRALRAGIWAD